MSQDNENQQPQDRAPRATTSIDVNYGSYDQYHLRKIANISETGAYVRTQDLRAVGSELTLRFTLPKSKDNAIEALCQVVWTYRQPASAPQNSSGMGVKFIEISDKDRKKIQKFVSQSIDE